MQGVVEDAGALDDEASQMREAVGQVHACSSGENVPRQHGAGGGVARGGRGEKGRLHAMWASTIRRFY
jgi:hypothetical protein